MLAFVEQLSEVKVEGVEPMTSVTPMTMKKRVDAVTDGGIADDIVRNAPMSEDNYFVVPKVVEYERESAFRHARTKHREIRGSSDVDGRD